MEEFVSLALTLPRGLFVGQYRYRFLVGEGKFRRPASIHRTGREGTLPDMIKPDASSFEESTSVAPGVRDEAENPRPLVLPVRKLHSTFPSMINVGRTANNDIVLLDERVSRFHAFFRVVDDERMELADAGSANGTWVGTTRLETRGRAHPVKGGDVLRFASLRFDFLDAGQCWEAVRDLFGKDK
jgi:hypothetical protein